jgi:hypothetical protein
VNAESSRLTESAGKGKELIMSKLVVLTDLGTFKAFALDKSPLNSTPRLQPVDKAEFEEGDDRIGRRVSDQAGQFTKNAPAFTAIKDQSNGERHNMWLENEKRSVKKIAQRISDLLSDGKFESCYLAASSEINKSILDQLPPNARAKIEKNVQRDLVNTPREQILQQFQN